MLLAVDHTTCDVALIKTEELGKTNQQYQMHPVTAQAITS